MTPGNSQHGNGVSQQNRSEADIAITEPAPVFVRRALGATRANILHYFQTENLVLATIGVALGMVLAYGVNLLLMKHDELPRLPGIYLPAGALALWAIGQLAVLGPALRASHVPPVVARKRTMTGRLGGIIAGGPRQGLGTMQRTWQNRL